MSIDIIITENPARSPANPTGRAMTFIENITSKVDGVFSWTIEAFGGFATAHFEMVVSEPDAWEMLNRLGKRVAFLSPDAPDSSLICWEGMIHSVNVDDGGATVSRSLENCYNTVRVNYTGIDDSQVPPATGGYEGTDSATDATSETAYGRRYLLYQAGTVAGATQALRKSGPGNAMRDLFLAQYANPRAGATTLRRGGGSSASSLRVSVDCVGFVHELALNFHSDVAAAPAEISTILSSIMTNTANGTTADWAPWGRSAVDGNAALAASWKLPFASTDTTGISVNTLTATQYNLYDQTTRTHIDELLRLGYVNAPPGPPTARRAFFGYYENRKFFYTVEPSTYDYITRRGDPSEAIYDRRTGAIVPPHLVRPAKAIGVPDIMPDETVVTDVLNTARAFVIGTVEFTAPATVVLTPAPPDPSGMWGTAYLEGIAPTAVEVPGGGYSGGLPPMGWTVGGG